MKNKKHNKGIISTLALFAVAFIAGVFVFFSGSHDTPITKNLGGGSGTIDQLDTNQVYVSGNDTTEGYLNGKLVAGTGISFTENNDGANETLTITGTGAPSDATYITQTANATLSAEQALSSLSSGIMRVATGTGIVTSLTDSSGIATNISDETGTGALVFGTSPTFTTQILNADGNVSAPSYSFSGDPDTGWYRVGSTMRYADEGVERVRITTNGNISVNANATGLATSNGLFHGTYDADPQDQDGIVTIDTYSDEGWTTTIGGRRARGTAAAPTQIMAGDKIIEFIGKGWDGHGDFTPSNRALMGFYANENWDSSSDNGTYITLNTTTDNTGANHQSLLVDDEGNVAVNSATTSTTTAVFPNLWSSTNAKHFVVKTGGASRDGGIFLRNGDDTGGTDIWYDASTASSYIDSTLDNTGGETIFRHRAFGTPVTSLTLNSTSAVFSLPVSVDTLNLTGTGTLNGLDVIDATGETTLEAALDIAGDVSGTGLNAVAIGADKVRESMLKVVDTPSDEECLTYESTVGDFEWQSCGAGGSTAWDAIGDPSGNGAVAMAETLQTLDWDTGAVSALAGDYFTLTTTNDAAADISTQRLLVLENKAASSNAIEAMQRILNSDSTAVGTGLIIDGAGAFTTAIDLSDSDIVTALSTGANDLSGTNWSIAGASGNTVIGGTLNTHTIPGGTDTFTLNAATQTLSNKTLTAPKYADLGFTADANGNELYIWDTVASAVNEITFANAATGANPQFSATGGDTDVGINFLTKAAGMFRFLGNATQAATIRLFEDTDDGTNYTAFKVGAQTGDVTYTLPTAAPTTSGMVLSSTTGGVQSWKQSYYTLQAGAAQFNPTDSSTIYFGAPVQSSGTDSDESQIQIPLTGTIVAVYVKANTGGTLGTTEDVALNLRLNDSTDTALTAMDFDTQVRKSSTTGLSIAVTAGDAINIKVVNPAWATNPTNVRLSAEILIAY